MEKKLAVSYGIEQRHYEKAGNRKEVIEEWEDGYRTDGAENTFEWWYFDSHLNDGSELVIIFYSKTVFDANGPLKPMVSFELTTPDGKKIEESVFAPVEQFSSSKETCDVRVGACTFSGNLKEYKIHFEKDNIVADIKLTGNIRAYRQGNSYNYFGDKEELYFAWLPSVPEGVVEAELSIDGVKKTLTGTGYHDHNWGNVNMAAIIHHWYWGRARVGKYNLITAHTICEETYGYAPLITFMLAENNEIIIGDDETYKYVTFSKEDEHIDEYTGKPVANKIIFDYNDGEKHYRVTYERKKDIAKHKMIDTLSGEAKEFASLAGFDGAYLRFTGKVTVDKLIDGEIVDLVTEPSGTWELMYFGKTLTNL